MKISSYILVTAGILAGSLPSFAQESEPADDFYVETTAGDDVFDPRAPTGFVTDLAVGELASQGEDLGDALDRTPGLFVLRRSSMGQPAYSSLRGGNPRQLSVSISGIELSIPAGLGFDVGGTSALGIERARVFRGAAGIHRGAGALTGAVELVPRLRLDTGYEVELTTVAGSFSTLLTSGTVAVDADWASVAMGAERRRSQGDFTFEDDGQQRRRVNNDHGRISVFGSTRIQITTIDSLTTVARFETGDRGTPGPSEFQNALRNARTDDARAVGTLRFDHRGLLRSKRFGTLDIYEAFGGQWRRERYENDQTAIGSGYFRADSEYTSGTAQGGIFHWYELDWVDAANAVRIDYGYQHEDYESSEEGAFTSDIETTRRTLSLSLSDEILLYQDYSLVGGVRLESLSGERDELATLPFLGASVTPLEWLRLQTNVARTYRPPDFDELYLNSEILRGDPDLVSERATVIDLGARAAIDDATIEVVLFQNSIEDPIRFLPVNVYLTQATNLDDYTARGVETSAAYQPFARLAIEGGYTFTRARLAEVDAQAPAVPRHTARAAVRAELAGWVPWVERAQVGIDARYRGAINVDLLGVRTSPAWVDLGAHLLVTPLQWLDVRVTSHNLLDRRDVTDVLQQPLPGRSFYIALTLRTEEP